jgi:pimeloyl-ACP methyl ester carboxylesterase
VSPADVLAAAPKVIQAQRFRRGPGLDLTPLLAKFHQERLILAGHSWGSVIAALTVAGYPELYSCFVGMGQVARQARL